MTESTDSLGKFRIWTNCAREAQEEILALTYSDL